MQSVNPLVLSISFVAMLLPLIFSTSVYAEKYFSMKNGQLERPSGYREWAYVGTPVMPNDMNNGKAAFLAFHNFYIDPKSWKYWKKPESFVKVPFWSKNWLVLAVKRLLVARVISKVNFLA